MENDKRKTRSATSADSKDNKRTTSSDSSEREFMSGCIIVGKRRSISTLKKCRTSSDECYTCTFDEQCGVEEGILDIYESFSDPLVSPRARSRDLLLHREKHSIFLRRGLKTLSDAYEALDASRPWLCYWILHSMNLLGIKTLEAESIAISKFLARCQDPENGGFGGGPGQLSHLAATYASVNALISLGIPESFSVVDRDLLLKFLQSMRLKDGSFQMHRGGEVDVRAVYCAVVVANLTDIWDEELFSGTAEWIVKCQTYEGGFAGFIGGEAHGGYTFCAVAALVLLKQKQLMNQRNLLKWLAGRQLPLEGGFQGRTNKLVDGCYSFWQGACFCLLGPDGIGFSEDATEGGPHWLFNQLALQEYILICCQHPAGGLIDKPGKQRDYYHTCYTLSGLSIAQHSPEYSKLFLENKFNELKQVHPVFNLTMDAVNAAQEYYYGTASTVISEVANDDDDPVEVS